MKEQINKLALQAREHADSLLGKKLPDMVWQDEYNKKLVELIVRECIGLCMNVNGDLPRTEPLVAASIRKYFGVE